MGERTKAESTAPTSEPIRAKPQGAFAGTVDLDAPHGVFGPTPTRSNVERMHGALVEGERDAAALTNQALPNYIAARDALDSHAIAELGGAALGLVIRMRAANAAASDLDHNLVMRSTPCTSPDPDLDPLALRNRAQAFVRTHDDLIQRALLAFTPHELRGKSVAGVSPTIDVHGLPNIIRQRLADELERSIRLIETVEQVRALVFQSTKETTHQARDKVEPWKSRPIDLAFLKAALGNVWSMLDDDAGGKLEGDLAHATDQAQHTGWFGDTGAVDMRTIPALLAMGNVELVYQQLMTADPSARALLLEQMRDAGTLAAFLDKLGWRPIKELHDSLGYGFADIKTVLQSYFIGGKDVFGKSLEEEVDHSETSLYHYVGQIPYIGGFLNGQLDAATLGFHSAYGQLHDAHCTGELSRSQYLRGVDNLLVRTAIVAAASMATGGAAGRLAGGAAATGMRMVGAGIVGGSAGAIAGLGATDAYNVYVSGDQDQFSSAETYLKTALEGGLLGGATAFPQQLAVGGRTVLAPEAPAASTSGSVEGMDLSAVQPEGQIAPENHLPTGGTAEPLPTPEQILEMETSSDLKRRETLAKEFVKNPNMTYHHYINKGGLRTIAGTRSFTAGAGTASYGGGEHVRAYIGEVMPGASVSAGKPVFEFKTVSGIVPSVRFFGGGRVGASWDVEALQVTIVSIQFPDGSIAIPDGDAYILTRPDSSAVRITAEELPE